MANTITGRIISIGQTQQIAGKDPANPYLRREIVINVQRFDPVTGQPDETHPNTPSLEFSGRQRCAELDSFAPGQYVTISSP